MLVAAVKPGHDGAAAIIDERRLVVSLESEKDTYPRHSALTPATLFHVAELAGRSPDVVALGGWQSGTLPIAAGYHGVDPPQRRPMRWFGSPAEFVTSSHVRSHIAMALGMAPGPNARSSRRY